jgi:hypothetical protein
MKFGWNMGLGDIAKTMNKMGFTSLSTQMGALIKG